MGVGPFEPTVLSSPVHPFVRRKTRLEVEVQFTWSASDGYVGGDRPQYSTIDDSEIEDCESEEEVRELIETVVREDFEQRVGPEWRDEQEQKVIERWKQIKSDASA